MTDPKSGDTPNGDLPESDARAEESGTEEPAGRETPSPDAAKNNGAAEAPTGSSPADSGDHPGASGTPKRRGGILGALALLVALGALGLAGAPYLIERTVEEDAADVPAFPAEDGRALAERLATLERDLASTASDARSAADDAQAAAGGLAEEFERLSRRIEVLDQEADTLAAGQDELRNRTSSIDPLIERVGRLEGTQSSAEASLEARMAALEERIEQRVESMQQRLGSLGADLEEAGQDSARRLALIHAGALLIQGRDRLELTGDANGARAAWRRAQRAVRGGPVPERTGDAIDRLVQAAADLAPLAVAERVRALDALAQGAAEWPAPGDEDVADNDTPGAAADDGWRSRMSSAMGRLVRVESIDSALPNRAEVDQARERIQAALSAAAVAAAREDWPTAGAMVERAQFDVEDFLDTDATEVRQALQRMDELIEAPARPQLPAAFEEAQSAVADALEKA